MNRFHAKKFEWKNKRALLQVALFLAVFGVVIWGIRDVSRGSSEQEITNLEQAVHKDMVLCYALEGFYPSSVEYMEEHYGLTYDKNRFVIDYEITGSNLMPDVMIVEK